MKSLVFVCVVLFAATADARIFGRYQASNSGGGTVSHSESLDTYQGPLCQTERLLLQRINEQRAQYGLRALILDPIREKMARRHTAWMVRNRQLTHSNEGAENIAMGYSTPEATVNQWMNSPGHRANILNPNYQFTGIAGYMLNGQCYWCQQFN